VALIDKNAQIHFAPVLKFSLIYVKEKIKEKYSESQIYEYIDKPS